MKVTNQAGLPQPEVGAAPPPLSPFRERFLEAVFESATDYAIVAMDVHGTVTMWNEGARLTLGWDEIEMVGRSIDTIFSAADRAAGRPAIEMKAALRVGRGADERWHVRKDGSHFWANGEMMPLRDTAGAHIGFLKILRDRTAQRLAVERQRADAEFLRSVLASSADCIKVLDLSGNLLMMTEVGQRVMEVSDFSAIQGCPWPDFWTGEGNLHAKAAVAAAMAGGVGHFQGMADTMAGNPRFWDVQVTPILDAEGKPEFLLSISRDVSATMLAERSLREAENLNTLILESSQDCIVVLDLEGRTQLVSAGGIAAMEIADVGAIIGLSWLRVWQNEDHAAACAAVDDAAAGRVGRFQGYCPTHRGTPKWWDVVISPLPAADGRPGRLVSIARDITQQRSAEAQLRDTEERRRLAVEAADIGTWSFEVADRTLDWDDRCRALFGYAPGAPITWAAYRAAIHPKDLDRAAATTAMAQDPDGPGRYAIEYRTIGADRVERWIAVAGKTLFEGRRPIRVVGTVIDITARKRAEEQARLLGEELQHRVKNTLAMVQAIVRQTLRNAATPAEAQAALDPRLAALARAHDMLTHGGWEGSHLRAVIDAALHPHDDGRAGRFHIDGPPAWLTAEASMSVALLLHELGTNAAKYGSLSVGTGRVDIGWTLTPLPGPGGDQRLDLVWRESGGPPVSEPTRRGFGSRLIENGLASALAGTAKLTFAPGGVTCVVEGVLAPHPG